MKLSILLNSVKYTVLNDAFVLGLHDVYREHNPGVKQDLPL
jgi:hypothetical protein